MAEKPLSFVEVEDFILDSFTGDPNLEKDYPIDVTRLGSIVIEGLIYNYRTVKNNP